MSKDKDIFDIIAGCIIIIPMPLIVIWALNALGITIVLTIKTYFAMLLLLIIIT